jgi:hypothetical protein
VDATGVTSYDEDPESVLLHKTSKNGKVTYLNIMLEAKLVTPEGLCLSLASEPLSNEEIAEYDKQDCGVTRTGTVRKDCQLMLCIRWWKAHRSQYAGTGFKLPCAAVS